MHIRRGVALKVFLAIALFILLLPFAYADIESYRIITDIDDGKAYNNIEIVLYNNESYDISSAKIELSSDAKILDVRDSYDVLEFDFQRNEGSLLYFNFAVPLSPGEQRIINIRTETYSSISDKGEYFEYLTVIIPEKDIADFELLLKLPKKSELYVPKFKIAPLVVPEATIKVNNDQINIYWKLPLKANKPFIFLARFKQPHSEWLYYCVIGIIFLAIGGLLGFGARRMLAVARKKKIIGRLNILNKREEDVLKIIINNPGMKQNDLKNRLDYTKSSLSKILRKLLFRGLVEKRKVGKINKLYPGSKLGGKKEVKNDLDGNDGDS